MFLVGDRGFFVPGTGEQLDANSSWQVVDESYQVATLRLMSGDKSFSKEKLLEFGRLTTGYAYDFTETIYYFGESKTSLARGLAIALIFLTPMVTGIAMTAYSNRLQRHKSADLIRQQAHIQNSIVQARQLRDGAKRNARPSTSASIPSG